MKNKYSIKDELVKKGFVLHDYSDDIYGIAESNEYYFRYYNNNYLQIGYKECFDRWANSVHFSIQLNRIAKDIYTLPAILASLEDLRFTKKQIIALKKSWLIMDFEEMDLMQCYRKNRKLLKRNYEQ